MKTIPEYIQKKKISSNKDIEKYNTSDLKNNPIKHYNLIISSDYVNAATKLNNDHNWNLTASELIEELIKLYDAESACDILLS